MVVKINDRLREVEKGSHREKTLWLDQKFNIVMILNDL